MPISERYNQALNMAFTLHQKQLRKGTDIPYISHLESVAAIVWKHNGSEDEAIAALLHDAAEDQGGLATLELIRLTFGDNVATIVAECSDTFEDPKPDWQPRKQKYIDELVKHSKSARLVSAADKLDNIRDIVAGYTEQGESFWDKFSGTRDQILWYYRSACAIYLKHGPQTLGRQIQNNINILESLVTERAINSKKA